MLKDLKTGKFTRYIKDKECLSCNKVFHPHPQKQKLCSRVCEAKWRISVMKRDNFKCQMGMDNCKGELQVHHILPWSKFIELRYQINNGITLCYFHHPRKTKDVEKLSPYFQELVASLE